MLIMETNQVKELFKKYRDGSCTEEEKALLESWYLAHNENQELDLSTRKIKAIGAQLFRELPGNDMAFLKIGAWLIAATILMGIIIAVAVKRFGPEITPAAVTAVHDVAPGTNQATLTLANGKKINLDDAVKGSLAMQQGAHILKTANGQISYQTAGNTRSSGELKLNNITTPAGGQWQVQLPDGTRVWINAASSLTYPVSFANATQRIVELSGEAYFEVAKDRVHPFVVKTVRQQVQVVGTHFDINSYKDEPIEKTTLLEGKVNVNSLVTKNAITLLPGQQSVLSNNQLSKSRANLEEAVAWKNGYFRFNDEKIGSIMRKLARWYNITVQYDGDVPTGGMNGKVSRSRNISKVLQALEATKTVRFVVEGRRVIVMK
jgi:transmembrane sensor